MNSRLRPDEIPGLTSLHAGEILRGLASQVYEDQAIVEIGVFMGRSLAYLSEGAQGSPVYGIDPWDLPRPSKPKYSDPKTYAAAQRYLLGYPVTLIRGFSVETAGNWPPDQRIGLLYIDADHRYLPVLQDFAAWAPHLDPDAWVTFDDCHPDFPGVIDAVEKLASLGRIRNVQMMTDRLAVGRFAE